MNKFNVLKIKKKERIVVPEEFSEDLPLAVYRAEIQMPSEDK